MFLLPVPRFAESFKLPLSHQSINVDPSHLDRVAFLEQKSSQCFSQVDPFQCFQFCGDQVLDLEAKASKKWTTKNIATAANFMCMRTKADD